MSVFNGLSAEDFLSDADTKVAYSAEITKGITARSKLKPFIGIGSDQTGAVIKSVSKVCDVGEIIGISLEDELIESGATGNVSLDASSEELKVIKQFIKVDRFQHTVPSAGSVVTQRSSKKFKESSKTALTNWGTRKFDKIGFSAMSADCTNIVACGHHTDASTTNIATADVLKTSDVEEAKRRALLGVDAEGKPVPPLVPVKTTQNENLGFYDEVEYFVMYVGTNSARNIKNDPNWAEARKDALERGKTNPIFSGALGFWDGVLLLDVKTDTQRQSGVLTSKSDFVGFGSVKKFDMSVYKGASDQETEINLLVGAGACHIAVDMGVQYWDYTAPNDIRRMVSAIDRVYGFAKTKYVASQNDNILADSMFDGKDYGVIAVVASTGL